VTLDGIGERFARVFAALQQPHAARRDALGQRRHAQARGAIPVRVREPRHDRNAEAAPHHLADRFERVQLHDVVDVGAEAAQRVFDERPGPGLPVEADERFVQQRGRVGARVVGGRDQHHGLAIEHGPLQRGRKARGRLRDDRGIEFAVLDADGEIAR